jgi:hypothetical protein
VRYPLGYSDAVSAALSIASEWELRQLQAMGMDLCPFGIKVKKLAFHLKA